MPESGERVVALGPQEIGAFMRAFLAQWRDYRLLADEIRHLPPDRVLVIGRQSAAGARERRRGRGHDALALDAPLGRIATLLFERDHGRVPAAAGMTP